jgi:hypothetical protein
MRVKKCKRGYILEACEYVFIGWMGTSQHLFLIDLYMKIYLHNMQIKIVSFFSAPLVSKSSTVCYNSYTNTHATHNERKRVLFSFFSQQKIFSFTFSLLQTKRKYEMVRKRFATLNLSSAALNMLFCASCVFFSSSFNLFFF